MNAAGGDGGNRGSERRADLSDGERNSKMQARRLFAPQPDGLVSDEAIRAGLRPEDVYVYVERSQGRPNRPYQTGSTVGRKNAAHLTSKLRTDRKIKKWDKGEFIGYDRDFTDASQI